MLLIPSIHYIYLLQSWSHGGLLEPVAAVTGQNIRLHHRQATSSLQGSIDLLIFKAFFQIIVGQCELVKQNKCECSTNKGWMASQLAECNIYDFHAMNAQLTVFKYAMRLWNFARDQISGQHRLLRVHSHQPNGAGPCPGMTDRPSPFPREPTITLLQSQSYLSMTVTCLFT